MRRNNIETDFDRERNDMYETIFELNTQLKLKNYIIQHFVPEDEFKKIEKLTVWNEEITDWVIKPPVQAQKTNSKRPQSAVGMKRPTSEYSRIAKGLGDLNPRYKFDNILPMDLDMPERTTEDYQDMPSQKVQQNIEAILKDDDGSEQTAITTLINFQDSILDEGEPVKEAGKPSGQSQNATKKASGGRPKSAKKKPV